METQHLDRSALRKSIEWNNSVGFDSGEAEAIALAVQVNSDWFLTDDALAKKFSESLGLETHGPIGILLWAVAEGHIQDRSA